MGEGHAAVPIALRAFPRTRLVAFLVVIDALEAGLQSIAQMVVARGVGTLGVLIPTSR